jgi:PAS domain S-box-containing protein
MSEPDGGTLLAKGRSSASFGFELARKVAEIVASSSRLRDQLHRIAQVIARLSGIDRVLVVALDEEETPLTSGSKGLSLRRGGSELEGLFKLHQVLRPELGRSGWIEIDSAILGDAEEARCLALPLRGVPEGGASGLALVSAPRSRPMSEGVLQALEESSAILAAAIRSAIRAEAWNRVEDLQRLAQETFREERDWDLQVVVDRLAEDFEAGAVTMLLKDQEELRLAASTDPQLGKDDPVIYRPGEGLTGHVFALGRGFRLRNTEDMEEIRAVTGLQDRTGPLHPERDHKGVFTGQFMGVPMRFGGKAVGVVRMSRREVVARFTQEDQKALQFFADLLGAALAPSWYLLLAKSVLDSVSDAIAVTRRDPPAQNRIVLANEGAEMLLERSKEELETMEARQIYAPAEYDRLHDLLKEDLDRGAKSCGPFGAELLRPDGTLVPITISYRFLANPLVKPPTQYTIGLARDLSEADRLAAQHKSLLELLDTFGIAYFQADREGRTLRSTQRDSEITGYPAAELKALRRTKLYRYPTHREGLLEKARRNEGKVSREAVQMRRKDGTFYWAEGDLRVFTDANGQEIGSEGFYRDVTDRMSLQRFLNEDSERILSEDELFTLLKQDAEFHLNYLNSLSHQLQTPLTSLIHNLRNLEKGVVSPRGIADRLPYVIGQAVVCTRFVQNLSYMDKVLRGESFQREKVSLARLAIETKLDFIHLLREKKLDLVIDDESVDRVLHVQGHQEMLRQVVINLMDNAIKYSLPRTSIHIRARHWPDGPSFEITNVGLPIPEDEHEKIFQRGHRARKAQALIPHGTGLGLWLVRKIVEAHGAKIRFYEVDECGPKRNLFRICFPQPSRRAS